MWKVGYVKAAILLLLFGSAAQAQTNGMADHAILLAHYGVGPTQSAELILDNGSCNESAMVTVETTDQQGLIMHEVIHVVQSGGAVYPVPLPSSSGGRSHFALEVQVDPGPCAGEIQAAVAIINGDRRTAIVSHIPTHTPEWHSFNPHDPGGSVAEIGQNNYIQIIPAIIGSGQIAEFAFWNNCSGDISVELRLKTTVTGEDEVVTLGVDIGPSQFKQLSFAVEKEELPTVIRGFGIFKVMRDPPLNRNSCPPGLGLLRGTMNLVDDKGNTTNVISGLPTGKRQHKPF